MKEIILLTIGLALATSGVVLVFDARGISKKNFGFGDQNEATAGMKILGYVIAMIGTLIIYFN